MPGDADPTGVPESGPRARGYVAILAVLAVVVGVTAVHKVFDFDTFWHVATGRWIWEHHAIPVRDPFSHTSEGPLLYTDALAQLFFYVLDRIGGGNALSLGGGILACGYALSVALLCGVEPERSLEARLLAVTCVSLASSFRYGPKTEMFSFVAYALLLWLVQREERSPANGWRAHRRGLAALFALCLVWGNCTRGGTIAPCVLTVATGAWALRARTRALVPVGALGVAVAFGALLLNSGGLHYFSSTFDQVAHGSVFQTYLPQHQPLRWAFLKTSDPWALALVAVWALATATKPRFDAETALVAFSVALPFASMRYLPFAAIAMAPGVARGFDRAGEWLSRRGVLLRTRWLRSTLVLVGSSLVLLVELTRQFPAATYGLGVLDWRLPVRAAAFLRAYPPPGRMWNSYDFGGYLIYALGPAQKDFIDGRADTVYSKAFFEETMRAHADPAVLEDQIRRYDVSYAVVSCSKLEETRYQGLLRNPAWSVVFFDDVAAVLVKRTRESEPYVAAHEYALLNPSDALKRVEGLGRLAPDERAEIEREVERLVHEVPDSVRARLLWGGVLKARGDGDGARGQIELARMLAESRGVTLDVSL